MPEAAEIHGENLGKKNSTRRPLAIDRLELLRVETRRLFTANCMGRLPGVQRVKPREFGTSFRGFEFLACARVRIS